MLGYCWPTVFNTGPTLTQHWFNVLCLLCNTSYNILGKISHPNPHSQHLPTWCCLLYITNHGDPAVHVVCISFMKKSQEWLVTMSMKHLSINLLKGRSKASKVIVAWHYSIYGNIQSHLKIINTRCLTLQVRLWDKHASFQQQILIQRGRQACDLTSSQPCGRRCKHETLIQWWHDVGPPYNTNTGSMSRVYR